MEKQNENNAIPISNSSYMNNRIKAQRASSFRYQHQSHAISRVILTIRRGVLTVQKEAFQSLKQFSRHLIIPKRTNKSAQLYQQFIQHCAIIIQSRFRGYMQKKRYRQFLPIYRRFRQLLFAGFQGWKVRKIIKLQPIKTQIQSIRDKIKIKQLSMSRIAKRQLCDQIERLRRKGRWVQIALKYRQIKTSSKKKQSKENSSMYGNIKSKCIKNIFQQNSHIKKEETDKNTLFKKQLDHFTVVSTQIQRNLPQRSSFKADFTHSKQKKLNFDDIQLKPPKDFNTLLEQQFPLNKQNKSLTSNLKDQKQVFTIKNIVQYDIKCKQRKNLSIKKTQGDSDNSTLIKSQSLQNQESSSQRSKVIQPTQIHQMFQDHLKQINVKNDSSHKQNKPKRLKITLALRKQSSNSMLSASRTSNESRQNSIEGEKKKFAHCDVIKNEQINVSANITSLLKGYNESYLPKKMSLKAKIKNSYSKIQQKQYFKSFLGQ